jgi:glycosyltransferase involved in cell wall biosynthesis
MDELRDIVFVGPFPPIRGGIAQHSAALVATFADSGSDIDVISWRSQYPRFIYPGEQAVMPRALKTHYLRWWSPLSWLRARRQVHRARQVIFAWVSPVHAIPLRIILGGARHKVAVAHNARPHENLPFANLATRWVLKRVDGIVVHSDAVAAELSDIVDSRNIQVVPHPPNLVVAPTPLPPGRPRLLFFGYIRQYKGVDLLIQALALLRSQGIDVGATIAGESWDDPAALEELAKECGVDDLVDFRIGYVPDSDVPALMQEHHIIIQPYRSASQSGVVPIAFAAGRPVVVTPVGGLSETVRHGENGIVASSVDPGSIADAIEQAVAQQDDLARGAAESAASWARVAAAVYAAGAANRES